MPDQILDFDRLRLLVKSTPLGGLPLAPVAALAPEIHANWRAVNTDLLDAECYSEVSESEIGAVLREALKTSPQVKWKTPVAGGEDADLQPDLSPLAKAVLAALPSQAIQSTATAHSPDSFGGPNAERPRPTVELRWSAPQEVADTAAKLYLQKVEKFLGDGTIGNLIDLNRILNHVPPEAIDLGLAESVVGEAMAFLNGDLTMCLAVSETVLQYRLKRPDALRLNSVRNINAVIAAFKAVVLEIPSTLEAFVGVEWVIAFWVRLIKDNGLDSQQCLPLLLSAYSVIFSANFQPKTISSKKYDGDNVLERARRKCADLVLACYSAHTEMRKEIIHDVLQNLSKLGKWRRGFSVSYAAGSGSIHIVVALILRMIQKSGETQMAVWHNAADAKSRQALEKVCKVAHREATNFCVLISKYLVEACHTSAKTSPIRVMTQCFIADMASTLPFAEWPASELFISCFVGTLFHASPLYLKQRSFMVFLLDMLKIVESALFTVYKSSSDVTMAGTIIDQLVRLQKPEVANFLATTLCARPTAAVPYLECYARMTTEAPPYIGYRRIPQSQWFKVLKHWQIGSYYEQIMEVMLAITCEGNAVDKSQVEILKLLAQCVETNPAFFDRVRDKLLTSIQDGSPSICDGALLVLIRYVAVTSVDGNFELISRSVCRVASPGLAAYKKRCAKFLAEVFLQTELEDLRVLAWRFLLRISSDTETAVQKLGLELLQELVYTQGSSDRSKHLEILSTVFLKVHGSDPPYPWLLRRFLRLTLITLPSEKNKRVTIRDLVGFLLRSIGEGGRPDFSALQAASIVLEANGFYLPNGKIPALFSLSCSKSEDPSRRLLAFRMLNAAVTATPRMIISPRIVTHYFPVMLAKLQVYTEPEIEYAAQVLWSLCNFGSVEDRKKRHTSLERFLGNVILHFEKQKAPKTSDATVLVSQLLLLMTAGVRFWVDAESIHPQRNQVMDCIITTIRSSQDRLRLAGIVCLIKTCTRYPSMFLDPKIDDLLHKEVLIRPSSDEWNIFIMLLLEFLQAEEDLLELKAKDTAPKGLMSDTLLHSSTHDSIKDSASAGLLQRYLAPILARVLASEDTFAAVATRLLVQSIEAGRVDIHESLPVVIALTTAESLEISRTAQRGYSFIVARWRSTVEQRLSEGLHLAVDYHKRCQTGPVPPKQVALLWEELRSEPASRQVGTTRLINSLKNCSTEFAVAVISGLAIARIQERDVQGFVKSIEDVCYACDLSDPEYSAESIAIMIALYTFRLLILSSSGDTNEMLHQLDVERIIARYSSELDRGRDVLEQLLDIDHFSNEVETLIYGSKRRRQ